MKISTRYSSTEEAAKPAPTGKPLKAEDDRSTAEASEPLLIRGLETVRRRFQAQFDRLQARWTAFASSPRFEKFASWGLTVAGVLLTALLRLAMHPWLQGRHEYIIFLPAIALTAWYTSTKMGLFALLLGMLVGNFFFNPPYFQFGLNSVGDLISVLLYLITGCTLIGIAESQHQTKLRLERALETHARHEHALRQSEERFRLASEAIHGMLYDWDVATGRVRRTSKFLEIMGILPDREETSNEWWQAHIHPEDVESAKQQIAQALQGDENHYALEYRVRHWEGHYIYVQDNGHILRDAEGKAVRVVGYAVDITERMETQAEIEGLNMRLQRSIAESHHRIKNNLQVLAALVDMETLEGVQALPVAAFERVAQHIRTLAALHDLLTREARSGSDLDSVSLPDALAHLLELMRPTSGERRLLLEAEEVRLPLKQSGSFTLMVNEIVSNAIKHGKGDVEITLTAERTDDETPRATLIVCDDGPGFAPNFDPKQAANTGLELIESMGRWDLQGEILYQNRPEGGARVVVTFPTQA
jgi:PAS domain S-box-containing protein